jgi:acetyl esterase/lipase
MSWQNRWIKFRLRRELRKAMSNRTGGLAALREATARPWYEPKIAPGWRLRIETDGPLPGEWIERDGPRPDRAILHLHGGGYMFCTAHSYRPLAAHIAAAADALVFTPDYRRAPEHKFPAQIEDGVAAYRRLIAEGTPTARIAITGDSAGGGLALAVILRLRELGEPLPGCIVLFSPWVDLEATAPSLKRNAERDPSLIGENVGKGLHLYLGDVARNDPRASPFHADLAGLPPMLIQVGDIEVLLDDSTRLAEKVRAAKGEVDCRIWKGVPHVWQNFAPVMPEARAAIAEAAAFIASRTPRRQ